MRMKPPAEIDAAASCLPVVGGLLLAAGAVLWVVVLLFPEIGRNTGEALAIAGFGVLAPAIGALVLVGCWLDRRRARRGT